MTSQECATDGPNEDAYLLALHHLEKLGPTRLEAMLRSARPSEVWQHLAAGELPPNVRLPHVAASLAGLLVDWQAATRTIDPRSCWSAQLRSGHDMFRRGDEDFPLRLVADPEPPERLFVRGTLPHADVPTVALVGTRQCSVYGNRIAEEFGRDLASSGVCVISGLAKGIDAAAHRGALSSSGGAPPLAVVATGLDLSYPRATAGLAEQVAEAGAIVSEYPLGTPPTAWRFPARNRIVAALADVVVVVESATVGGSMHTVNEAMVRDVGVLAVPGPVGATSSEGTNMLLFDGCGPARSADDVLDYLGLFGARAARRRDGSPSTEADDPAANDPVLEAVDWWPTSVDDLCRRTGMTLGPLSVQLEALVRSGHLVSRGSSFERRR